VSNENLKGQIRNYLDKGYVQLVDYMGDDLCVVNAARVSYGGAEYQSEARNKGLINYLMEHNHSSPFEMPIVRFRLKMPIFVARQFVRHRTASLNEYSLRYSEQNGEYYLPDVSRFCFNSVSNHQGSGEPLPKEDAEKAQQMMKELMENELATYRALLNMGVAREVARSALGVNFYTEMVWQNDLRNLFHFLSLRNDSHAQIEIQQLAEHMEYFVEMLYPMCYNAYKTFVKGKVSFSSAEYDLIKESVRSAGNEAINSGIDSIEGSKRRFESFVKKIK
jgi:thymidylate synthase (FAD)